MELASYVSPCTFSCHNDYPGGSWHLRSCADCGACCCHAAALYGLNLLVSATVLLIPLAFGLVNPDKIFGEDNTGTWHVLIIERGKVCVFIFPFVGMLLMQAPVAFAYYLSHRVAVTLAQNEVGRLAVNVRPRAVIDDQTWSEDLARPALRLATHTVPALSAWGGGTVVVFVAAILFSTLHFILMVHNIYAPLELKVMNDWDREDGEYNPLVNFIPCLAAATLPILLSQDVAHVSVSDSSETASVAP